MLGFILITLMFCSLALGYLAARVHYIDHIGELSQQIEDERRVLADCLTKLEEANSIIVQAGVWAEDVVTPDAINDMLVSKIHSVPVDYLIDTSRPGNPTIALFMN